MALRIIAVIKNGKEYIGYRLYDENTGAVSNFTLEEAFLQLKNYGCSNAKMENGKLVGTECSLARLPVLDKQFKVIKEGGIIVLNRIKEGDETIGYTLLNISGEKRVIKKEEALAFIRKHGVCNASFIGGSSTLRGIKKELNVVQCTQKSNLENQALDWLNAYILGLSTKNPSESVLNFLSDKTCLTDDYLEETTDYCLYRGFYFKTSEEFLNFVKGIKNNNMCYVDKNVSSWTDDVWVSYNFLHGSGYAYYNGETSNGYGVILSCSEIVANKIIASHTKKPPISKEARVNLDNESEYIIKPCKFNVEFKKMTHNCRNLFDDACLNELDTDVFLED